jgi:pimeloyl-ACP methyl ester carboxylesterase
MILNYKVLQAPAHVSETIVMVHGLQSSHQTFYSLNNKMPESWHVIAIDQKGHGASRAYSDAEAVFTSEKMAADLKIIVTQLGLKNFHLLGHSMGGRTAIAYASEFPADLKSLIIEDIGPEQRRIPSLQDHKKFQKLEKEWRHHNLIFATKEEIAKVLMPLFSYADSLLESKTEQLPDGRWQLLFNPGVAALYGYEGNMTNLTTNLTQTLLQHQIPITFFVADFDVGSAMTENSLENIKQFLPMAEIKYFPKAWHNIHKSQTSNFLAALNDWICRLK